MTDPTTMSDAELVRAIGQAEEERDNAALLRDEERTLRDAVQMQVAAVETEVKCLWARIGIEEDWLARARAATEKVRPAGAREAERVLAAFPRGAEEV